MKHSYNCPECGSPDLLVVEPPDVECLACGCLYQFSADAKHAAPPKHVGHIDLLV